MRHIGAGDSSDAATMPHVVLRRTPGQRQHRRRGRPRQNDGGGDGHSNDEDDVSGGNGEREAWRLQHRPAAMTGSMAMRPTSKLARLPLSWAPPTPGYQRRDSGSPQNACTLAALAAPAPGESCLSPGSSG